MQDRIAYQGITFDDVLLEPAYSDVLPREVDVESLGAQRHPSTKLPRLLDRLMRELVRRGADFVDSDHHGSAGPYPHGHRRRKSWLSEIFD